MLLLPGAYCSSTRLLSSSSRVARFMASRCPSSSFQSALAWLMSSTDRGRRLSFSMPPSR